MLAQMLRRLNRVGMLIYNDIARSDIFIGIDDDTKRVVHMFAAFYLLPELFISLHDVISAYFGRVT